MNVTTMSDRLAIVTVLQIIKRTLTDKKNFSTII